MLRKILLAALGVLVVFLVYAAFRMTQESGVGIGPRTTAASPAGETREVAIVGNAMSGSVTLIDVQGREVIGSIDVTPDGKRVGLFRDPIQSLIWQPFIEGRAGLNYAQDTDLSPDGTVLYVSRGHLGDVAAFDIATGELMWRVGIDGARSDHMAISPDGDRLYVSELMTARVIVIDTRTACKVGSFVTGAWPHDNHVSEDGRFVYNASLGDMTVDVAERDNVETATEREGYAYQITLVDAQSLDIIDRFRFEAGIRPFAVTHDRRRIFAQLSNTHSVVEYDTAEHSVVHRLDLPVAEGATEADWDFEAPHHGLALSHDEQTLCLAGRASDYAGLVSTNGLQLILTVPVGDAPSWAVIDSTDQVCILANTRSDNASIISLADGREVARLPTQDYPKHISIGFLPQSVIAAVRSRAGS